MSSSSVEQAPLHVVRRAIIDLVPDVANMRTHSAANIEAIKASLKRWGQQKPIVIDAKSVIRCGNGTVEAAKKLGWTHIDCVVSELDGAELSAFAIADNRTAEMAGWSEEIGSVIGGLQIELPDLDIAALSFDVFEPETSSSGGNEVQNVDPTPIDNSKYLEKWGVRPGQVWKIGNHTLACGSCLDESLFRNVLGGRTAEAVVTDPPYGISYKYDIYNDGEDEWYGLMMQAVPKMRSAAKFVIIPCCQINRLKWWYGTFPPDWMICWYKGSTGHIAKIGFNDWEPHLAWGIPYNQMHDYFQTRCGFDVDGHPCPKPLEYAEWLVERAASPGGIVLDMFSGSGTTLLACQSKGRIGVGIELSPSYVAYTLERFLTSAGIQPVLSS